MTGQVAPPRLARRLLAWLLPDDARESILGDLEEVYREWAADRGRLRARLWYWKEAVAFSARFGWERLRNRPARDADESGAEAIRSRGRGGTFISWLDVKLGFRMLVKYPGLTLAGGLAIAFAVWVGAGTFEFATQVLHPTLPLPDGDRIVGVRVTDAETGRAEGRIAWDFVRYREDLRSVEQLGAFRTLQRNLIVGDGPGEPVDVAEMTASGFRVARVSPLMGRTLVEEDETPGASPVVVLGHDVWRTRFGGDPEVVGRTVRLGNVPATVVGVMPEGFAFPVAHNLWTPLRLHALDPERRQGPGINVFGRLAAGVTLEEAQAELATVGRRVATAFPDTHEHLRPHVLPYARAIQGMSAGQAVTVFLFTNLFLVMLVVLVCGNVALLMFARAASRESEIVVRSALGASRGRIVGQLFTEALVLGGVAALIGLSAAKFGLELGFSVVESSLEGGRLPFWTEASLSPVTYLYAAGLTVLAAVVSGVIPALKMTGRKVGARLKKTGPGSGGPSFGGVWTAVIVCQVAVTVAFPATAYFVRKEMKLIETFDVGFREGEYLSVRLEMDRRDAAEGASEADRMAARIAGEPVVTGGPEGSLYSTRFERAVRELEERLELDLAVAALTVADRLPRMYHPWKQVEVDEGAVAPPDERGHRVSNARIALDYFEVLETEVLSGRGFDAGDVESDARVVLVNRAFVESVLGGKNPVGRRVRYVDADWWDAEARTAEDWYEVVGVAPNLAMTSGYGEAGIYHPLATAGAAPLHLAVHVRGEPEAFAPRLREVATAVDPTLRLHGVLPMDELDAPELLLYGFWLRLTLIVSGLALLLSLSGIYAVMAFTVSRRTREIGVRVALGASTRRVVAAIFARPLVQVGIGVLLGTAWTAFLATMFVGSAGHSGLEGAMPFSWRGAGLVAGYAAFMMGVCMLACVVPTRRALNVEPTEALRAEG